MQVEGQHELSLLSLMATGARVSNTYPTFRLLRDSLSKERLIPDSMVRLHDNTIKDLLVNDGDAFHSVVGGVTAHLADDG